LAIGFSRKHKFILTGDSDGVLLLWDANMGEFKKCLSDFDFSCTDSSNFDRSIEKVSENL
jgi:hypothetical protein